MPPPLQLVPAPPRRRRTGRRMLAAAMLGVAAILGPRADPTDFWARTPIEHVQRAEVTQLELSAVGSRVASGPRPRRRAGWRRWFAPRRGRA